MEKPHNNATVVLLLDDKGRVCLARKKQAIHHTTGEIGYSLGMYNGYGGKMEVSDRTILDTAVRELFDESGVRVKKEDLELVARVYFYIKKHEEFIPFMEVSFFSANIWSGDPREGDEMGPPHFFRQDEIPYDEMMPADEEIFTRIFSGERRVYRVKLLGKGVKPIQEELSEDL